ncbi:Zn(II)2Cys6 transcription factor domain-containing protein [Aspergillus stella-maris]|uniref:Zn(II)2Cys6 transcription factor domain-containing protein n=1 Tax=Aspergillus stella-maris TaxID=1810926 RepID=UPI003CCC90E3
MPAETADGAATKPRKIGRAHSGCKSCRKRGKKCDETKPKCRACARLGLECGYGVEHSFRNVNQQLFQRRPTIPLSTALDSASNIESRYLDHFTRHVRHLIPEYLTENLPSSPQCHVLRSAMLCISASNLSMLNASVQRRALPRDPTRSVYSPLVNQSHQAQARKFHDQALAKSNSSLSEKLQVEDNAPAILTAYTILAYYHHASTNHRQFRLAVWETVRFVSRHREVLTGTKEGNHVLQMWYRLCVSHRLGKPPALLLEGEGNSHFGPNRYPDCFEQLYLNCILGMSTDDLIYDILIKTMEIRSRLVVFECVGGRYGRLQTDRAIGDVAHNVLNHLLGKDKSEHETEEAQQGFVRGAHLRGLLDVQHGRLAVWKSRLRNDQQPDANTSFPSHRDAMNALYAFICEMMFDESTNVKHVGTLIESAVCIINNLDLTTSATADIYTFSLTEILLQLVQVHKSEFLFTYILDNLWPKLESKARGYEHSHYPTHLVKRMIALTARYWGRGRDVRFTLPAVPEDIAKVKLLDIYHPVDVVVCGCDTKRAYFVERVPLP